MSDHVLDQLPGFALGVLDPEEQWIVDQHLESCTVCTVELEHINEVVSSIPTGLDVLQPPPDLKRKLLIAAKAQPPVAPRPDVLAGLPPSPAKPRQSRLLSMSFLAAMAVALFAVGLTVGNLFGNGTGAQQRYQNLVAAAVSRGDRVQAMQPAAGAPAPVHLAVDIAASGSATLIVGPTASPPKGDVYQLWFIRGKQAPVSVGVFSTTSGEASSIALPKSASGYQVTAMTVEPGPTGSTEPTTSPFVTAKL